MKVLGINHTHDSGAAIVKDGKITAAINEERLTRFKGDPSFPYLSISKVLEMTGSRINDMDYIAFSITDLKDISKRASLFLLPGIKKLFSPALYAFLRYHFYKKEFDDLTRILRKTFGYKGEIRWVDHHMAHAAAAYYTSGFRDALVITLDAGGDILSSTFNVAENYEIKRFFANNEADSLGKLWERITTISGMSYNKHEGKLLGLAAYRKPNPGVVKRLKKIFYVKGMGCTNLLSVRQFDVPRETRRYFRYFQGLNPRDIAPALQKITEEAVIEMTSAAIKKTGMKDIALAGGVFSNVRVNQKIRELKEVERIFIHPHMGDGGTTAGAALYVWAQEKLKQGGKPKPYAIQDAYLGPEFSNDEIEDAFRSFKLKPSFAKDAGKFTGERLAKGKIIAFYQGRMEYGPRALGNRSILYNPADKTVNDWLNRKLARTDFMPFAPVTLSGEAQNCYGGYEKSPHPALFMTVTYDCTPWMKKNCPAVVHVDGTARPQVITPEINKEYYLALKTYFDKTGLNSIINTSFNMHEEPIICLPTEAIKGFLASKLDVLIAGNWVYENEK